MAIEYATFSKHPLKTNAIILSVTKVASAYVLYFNVFKGYQLLKYGKI